MLTNVDFSSLHDSFIELFIDYESVVEIENSFFVFFEFKVSLSFVIINFLFRFILSLSHNFNHFTEVVGLVVAHP